MSHVYGLLLLTVELALLATIAVIDARTLRAPNRLVYPAVALALLAALPLGLVTARGVWLGAIAAFAILLIAAIVSRGALGLGDTKVGALCGSVVGVGGVPTFLALSFVSAAALAVVLITSGQRSRHDVTAFTPFLLVGVVLTLVIRGPAFAMGLP